MKQILPIAMLLVSLISRSQSLDFGVEVQQNTNRVKKWSFTDEFSDAGRAFSAMDIYGDTLNFYFNSFSMSNNFEIPLYFRYNFKRRYFIDLKLSNTSHRLTMEGVTNYNDSYFVANYGSFNDFENQAQLSGFTTVDTADYLNYIQSAKSELTGRVRATEEFKVLGLTANFGVRLLPHRSIKPYLTLGYSLKAKYRKYSYQYFDFNNPGIYDNRSIQQGVNKFSEITSYFNLGVGAEFYRFRAGIYYQAGSSFQLANGRTNDVVIDVNPFTPFERIHSYGFTICANLFSAPLGKRVVYEDLETEDLIVSNVERKKYKWELDMRIDRRGFHDVTSFYANPENQLYLMTRDSILFSDGSTIRSAEKVEMVSLGDIKKISWSAQFNILLTRNLTRRFSVEFGLGGSNLVTDIESTEFSGTVLHDTLGNMWNFSNSEPRINSGVYRVRFNLTNFSLALRYKLIDRELFQLSVIAGIGYTDMLQVFVRDSDQPAGVNNLDIYEDITRNYYNSENTSIYAYQGTSPLDLNASPDDFFTNYGNAKLDNSWPTPKEEKFGYGMQRFGVEVAIDRFTLGMSVDRSLNYMDGFLLNTYNAVNFSMGYKLWRKSK